MRCARASAWRLALGMVFPGLASASPPDIAPPPPAEAMAVYEHVDSWVRQWQTPENYPSDLPPMRGAALTLRLGGRVLARKTMFDDDGVVLPLVQAVLDEAAGHMPFDHDVLWDDNLADAAQRITISLELAGALVPITAKTDKGRELAINPGLEGVAARLGDRIEAISPGAMLAMNTTPGGAMNIVKGLLVDDPALLAAPNAIDGLTWYRFRTAHLAQPGAGEPPVFLHRGGRLVRLSDLTTPMLERWSDAMAGYLIGCAWPGDSHVGLMGDYDPTADTFDPVIASPVSQAVCAYALLRYGSAPGVDPSTAARARETAADILADLAIVEKVESDAQLDPGAAALYVLACAEAERAGNHMDEKTSELASRCRAIVARSVTETGFSPDVPASSYGLVAHALAATARTNDEIARATQALHNAYMATPPTQLAAQMPWLGWAEMELAQEDVPAAAALTAMRSRVWAKQFTRTDARFGDQDLIGGSVLTRSASPLPSWHTARRVAFLATMVGDTRLTPPGEVGAELVRILQSLRFLRQLCVDEAVAHMCRDPEQAMWGIRSSLWDQRMPPDATAFTLLAVTETLRSIDAMEDGR